MKIDFVGFCIGEDGGRFWLGNGKRLGNLPDGGPSWGEGALFVFEHEVATKQLALRALGKTNRVACVCSCCAGNCDDVCCGPGALQDAFAVGIVPERDAPLPLEPCWSAKL